MRPRRHVIVSSILLAGVIISCSSPNVSTPQDMASVNAPGAVLEPGEALGFEPEAVGTPEENPNLLSHVAPRDEETSEPVRVPVKVLLDGRVLGTGLREYTFELPGTMDERTELAVKAEGYQRWSLFLRNKQTNTREWDVPIKVKRLPALPVTPREL